MAPTCCFKTAGGAVNNVRSTAKHLQLVCWTGEVPYRHGVPMCGGGQLGGAAPRGRPCDCCRCTARQCCRQHPPHTRRVVPPHRSPCGRMVADRVPWGVFSSCAQRLTYRVLQAQPFQCTHRSLRIGWRQQQMQISSSQGTFSPKQGCISK